MAYTVKYTGIFNIGDEVIVSSESHGEMFATVVRIASEYERDTDSFKAVWPIMVRDNKGGLWSTARRNMRHTH